MTCIRCNGTGFTAAYRCTNCLGPKYAGFISGDVDEAALSNVAMQLALRGWFLWTSEESALTRGVDIIDRNKKVIRTSTGYEPAIQHAKQFHPNWDMYSPIDMFKHARDSMIVFGDWLDSPVSFALCWGECPPIVAASGIPVFDQNTIWSWLDGK